MKNSVARIPKAEYIKAVNNGLKMTIGRAGILSEVVKQYNRFVPVDDAISNLIMKS